MADDFEFRRARQVLERIPREINAGLRGALKSSGVKFQQAMIDRFTGYSNPRSDETKLQSRNGTSGLRKSIGFDVSGEFRPGGSLRLLAFTAGKPYAQIQEYGGEVKPKRGKYLTIPIADNITPGGRARYPSAADLHDRNPGLTYFAKSKKGSLLLFAKGDPDKYFAPLRPGEKQSSKPPKPLLLFVLKTSVRIPPRLGFRKTWNGLASDRVDRINRAVTDAVNRAQGGGA